MYAYYILHTLRRFPSEWMELSYYEQVAIEAFIDEKIEADKKQKLKHDREAKARKSSKSSRRPRRRRR